MDYYAENPSLQDQIDYIVFDCIVNEQAKIYSKEEWQSYLLSLLLSPPLDIRLNPDVLESLWEIDAQLVIQSIEHQHSEMRAQLHHLEMQPGKHSTKIAMQISEIMLQLEMRAVECSKLLKEETHRSRIVENVISGVDSIEGEVVIEDDKLGFPLMPSSGPQTVDLVKYDGLDVYVDASKSAPKSEPLVLHGKSMHEEVKRGVCHLSVEEATIILRPLLLPSPCYKLWDPGGRSYAGSTHWSFYHKQWDPGGF